MDEATESAPEPKKKQKKKRSAPPVEPLRPVLYDPQSIAIATFFGSPLAGSILWAINQSRIGEPAALTVGAGVLGTGALMWLGQYLPNGAGIGATVGLIFGMRAAAKSWVEQRVASGVIAEPYPESRWKAAAIGALVMLAIAAVVFAFVFATTEE